MDRRIAVFQTLEMYSTLPTVYAPKGHPTQIRHHPGEPSQTPYYSTGKLEAALEQGCDVWVLHWFDVPEANDWWIGRVNQNQVLDAREAFNHPSGQAAIDLMRQLYALLDLPWDNSIKGYREGLDELAKHGILRGYMFSPSVPLTTAGQEAAGSAQDATIN
jgi:hypothetical protein